MSKKLVFLGLLFGLLIGYAILSDLYWYGNRTYLGSFQFHIAVELGAFGVVCLMANVVWPGHLTKLLSVCFFLMGGMIIMIGVENGWIIPKQYFIGLLLLASLWGICAILILYLLLPRPQQDDLIEFEIAEVETI